MAVMATLVCVLLIGTAAQIFSERIKIPATGPLLIVGLLFGKDVIGLIQPQILEIGLSLIVKMAVAVIVFEGGLLLNVYDLRHTSRAVTGLITVGLLITTALAAMLAHFFLGLSWEISVLFGAIVSITGPTVITPILEKINVNRRVRSTLETESVIADPLGVILASIIFFAITNKGEWTYIITHGLETVLAGVVVGVLVGLYIWLVSNRFHLLPAKYARIVILGAALVAYTVAELFAHEAGVLAAAIAGIVIGSLDIPHKEQVEEFKGDNRFDFDFRRIYFAGGEPEHFRSSRARLARSGNCRFIDGCGASDSCFSFDFRFGIENKRETFHIISRTARNRRGFDCDIFLDRIDVGKVRRFGFPIGRESFGRVSFCRDFRNGFD